MALTRVKTGNVSTPELAEAQVVVLAAIGSDGKPYLCACDEAAGTLTTTGGGGGGGTTYLSVKDLIRLDYTGTNVTTGAWVQLLASSTAAYKKLDIFDSSGQTLTIGIGGAGAEVAVGYVHPGGCTFEHAIPIATRISIKAVSGTANVGYININAMG